MCLINIKGSNEDAYSATIQQEEGCFVLHAPCGLPRSTCP